MILVAFEGPSGSGKSTAIEGLKKILEERGFKVGVVDTDSGTHRRILQKTAKRFFAHSFLRNLIFWIVRFREARAIRKMDEGNFDVLFADRYAGTSVVFSISSGIPETVALLLYRFINPKPDVTFFFKIPLEEIRKRKLSETNIKTKSGFSELLCSNYWYIAKKFDWQTIDASQTESEVATDCIGFIFEKMKK